MREQDRDKQSEPVRQHVAQRDNCLDVLIRQHGDEHIDTLARLISLTTRVANCLEHNIPYR